MRRNLIFILILVQQNFFAQTFRSGFDAVDQFAWLQERFSFMSNADGTMDDGNFLIEYSQPAFTIVFKEELEENRDYIEKNHLQGICTSESIN